MDCLAAGSLPLFFDQHITAVMPFADILNYAEFTEFIDPGLLIESQANAIDILEVRPPSNLKCALHPGDETLPSDMVHECQSVQTFINLLIK